MKKYSKSELQSAYDNYHLLLLVIIISLVVAFTQDIEAGVFGLLMFISGFTLASITVRINISDKQ